MNETKETDEIEADLCKFYSMPHVADLLVDFLPDVVRPKILDLGVGGGALSRSAVRRWPNSSLVTVDVDRACPVLEGSLLPGSRHRHITADALRRFLPLSEEGTFDVVLCNPPFSKLRWKSELRDVTRSSAFRHLFQPGKSISAEILFICQGLRFLREGGVLGLIIPDTLVTGINSQEFRRAMLDGYDVSAIIQLPRKSFFNTDANSHIVILRKSPRRRDNISLFGYDNLTGVTGPLSVGSAALINRMDYAYHARLGSTSRHAKSLRDLGAMVFRGSISATDARKMGLEVFHTTDFSSQHLNFSDPQRSTSYSSASEGDIVLARVGRALHLKVAKVVSGSTLVTDCVYVIRAPGKYQDAVFQRMKSEEGARILKTLTKGVGASHLPKSELMKFTLG